MVTLGSVAHPIGARVVTLPSLCDVYLSNLLEVGIQAQFFGLSTQPQSLLPEQPQPAGVPASNQKKCFAGTKNCKPEISKVYEAKVPSVKNCKPGIRKVTEAKVPTVMKLQVKGKPFSLWTGKSRSKPEAEKVRKQSERPIGLSLAIEWPATA